MIGTNGCPGRWGNQGEVFSCDRRGRLSNLGTLHDLHHNLLLPMNCDSSKKKWLRTSDDRAEGCATRIL